MTSKIKISLFKTPNCSNRQVQRQQKLIWTWENIPHSLSSLQDLVAKFQPDKHANMLPTRHQTCFQKPEPCLQCWLPSSVHRSVPVSSGRSSSAAAGTPSLSRPADSAAWKRNVRRLLSGKRLICHTTLFLFFRVNPLAHASKILHEKSKSKNLKKRRKIESHPKVSCRRSLSFSLRGHLVLSTTSKGSPKPAGSGFSSVGVRWGGLAGSPCWSGMGTTGVSGSAHSSGTLSSTSNEDWSWILSSGTHRREGRDEWRIGERGRSGCNWNPTW